MEAPEQVSEPHVHYMIPTVDTPDRQRYAEREEWWEAGHNCLLGRYEASGGVWISRLAKEGGLNEEDNWIRLQCRGQRGGVDGYLILAIGV
eukprot:scaffold29619_cov63-Attheya_sp.AAC.5